jgi:hypothetical protein
MVKTEAIAQMTSITLNVWIIMRWNLLAIRRLMKNSVELFAAAIVRT